MYACVYVCSAYGLWVVCMCVYVLQHTRIYIHTHEHALKHRMFPALSAALPGLSPLDGEEARFWAQRASSALPCSLLLCGHPGVCSTSRRLLAMLSCLHCCKLFHKKLGSCFGLSGTLLEVGVRFTVSEDPGPCQRSRCTFTWCFV